MTYRHFLILIITFSDSITYYNTGDSSSSNSDSSNTGILAGIIGGIIAVIVVIIIVIIIYMVVCHKKKGNIRQHNQLYC